MLTRERKVGRRVTELRGRLPARGRVAGLALCTELTAMLVKMAAGACFAQTKESLARRPLSQSLDRLVGDEARVVALVALYLLVLPVEDEPSPAVVEGLLIESADIEWLTAVLVMATLARRFAHEGAAVKTFFGVLALADLGVTGCAARVRQTSAWLVTLLAVAQAFELVVRLAQLAW